MRRLIKSILFAFTIIFINYISLYSAKRFNSENVLSRMNTINQFLCQNPKELVGIFNIWIKSDEVIKNIDEYYRSNKLVNNNDIELIDLENVSRIENGIEVNIPIIETNSNIDETSNIDTNQIVLNEEDIQKEDNIVSSIDFDKLTPEEKLLYVNKEGLLNTIKAFANAFHGLSLWLKPVAIESLGQNAYKSSMISKFFAASPLESSEFFDKEITDLGKLNFLSKELSIISEDIFANLSKQVIVTFLRECGKTFDRDLVKAVIMEHKRLSSEILPNLPVESVPLNNVSESVE